MEIKEISWTPRDSTKVSWQQTAQDNQVPNRVAEPRFTLHSVAAAAGKTRCVSIVQCAWNFRTHNCQLGLLGRLLHPGGRLLRGVRKHGPSGRRQGEGRGSSSSATAVQTKGPYSGGLRLQRRRRKVSGAI